MATSVREQTVDNRRTCSICLEAFRGRQPKILSCFHTFCSPCLIQLVEREARQCAQVPSSTQGTEGTGQTDRPVTLTCPTCRTCIPVPPGGVSQLQTNVNLDEDVAHDPSPLPCDFCEKGHKAEFQCANCINYFCRQCLGFHNQLCKFPAACLITDTTGSAGTQSEGKESQELVQRMEDVLKKVAEQEKKLALENRDVERDINGRYTTTLHLVAEARDSGLMSLRDVTQSLSDSLMNTASLAREVLITAKDKTSESHPRGLKDQILTESTRRHFEELLKKADDEPLLTHTITDNSSHVLLQSASNFIGTVVAVRSNVESDSTDPGVADGHQPSGTFQQTRTPSHQHANLPENINFKIDELTSQLQDLSARFIQKEKATAGLQAQNAVLCTDLVAVQDKNAQVSHDVTALEKEMTSLRDELTSQSRDLVDVRDKTCLLSQENDSVRSDVSSLKADHNQIQTDQKKLQTDCAQVSHDFTALQKEMTSLRDELTSQSRDLVDVTDKTCLLSQENDIVRSDVSSLKADLNQIHTHQKKLQTECDMVQTDFKQLQSEHHQVQTKQTKVESDVDQLQVDQNKLKTDQGTLTSDVQTLKTDVGQLEDLRKKDTTAIAGLETRLNKVNVHVAFHARLKYTVAVTQPQTIVCDEVLANVGGGYNGQTGVFTAPVSGTYCFMATSTSGSDDNTKQAALDIVMGEKDIGYLSAWGRARATAHCAVHMQAGQAVRLRSFHHETSVETRFALVSSFTGMLLQPDL